VQRGLTQPSQRPREIAAQARVHAAHQINLRQAMRRRELLEGRFGRQQILLGSLDLLDQAEGQRAILATKRFVRQ